MGVSLAGGDAELLDITEAALDRCVAINLKSCIFAARHVIPIMRKQNSGAIINISSMAAITTYPYVAYKATKAAMVAFTEQLAYQNAQYGIRANVILPGLMDTPMAVDTRAREFGKSRAEVAAERDAKVPAAQEDGYPLGRGQRRAVPGLRRGGFHHRRDAAGGRRRQRPAGLAGGKSAADLILPADSPSPWRMETPCRPARPRAACNSPRASWIRTAS